MNRSLKFILVGWGVVAALIGGGIGLALLGSVVPYFGFIVCGVLLVLTLTMLFWLLSL